MDLDPVFVRVAPFLLLIVALTVALVMAASRRQRRAERLVAAGPPRMRVRVEPWVHLIGTTPTYHLSIYPASSPAGSQPLACVAIDERSARDMGGAEVFDLYGDPAPGGRFALRKGETVFAPRSPAKPPTWERNRRTAASSLMPADTDLRLEPEEARVLTRTATRQSWLVPVSMLAPLIRLVPYRWFVLPLAGAGVLIAFQRLTALSRTRTLDRLAERTGPTPNTRRERRHARLAVEARLLTADGTRQMAAALGTTPEELHARRRRTRTLMVASMVGAAIVVVASFTVGADRWLGDEPSRRRPAVAGASDYTTYGGPLGRPLEVGRPWGTSCHPLVFSVDPGVPAHVYDALGAVVAEARAHGLNVTIANRLGQWRPADLQLAPGTRPESAGRVLLYTDTDAPRRRGDGHLERIRLGWNAAPAADGEHEVLTYVQGELHLVALEEERRLRSTLRMFVAFAHGIDNTTNSGSGLLRDATVDGFAPDDVRAMLTMSGCPHTPS